MARTASGSNMVRITLKNPASRKFRLEEIRDGSFIPAPFRDILKQFSAEINAVRMLNTSLKELFDILWLDPAGLKSAPPAAVFRSLRSFLKKEARTEFAPPGNYGESFSAEDRFIVCRGYDLFSDPDIIAARTYIGHKNTNALAAHRVKVAEEKISNFLVFVHLFEAIWLAASPEGLLTAEQRALINIWLEKSRFPDEGKLYLQYCFSGSMSSRILRTNLSEQGRYLKPLAPDSANQKAFLSLLGRLCAHNSECALTSFSWDDCCFITDLLEYYRSELRRKGALEQERQDFNEALFPKITAPMQNLTGSFAGDTSPLCSCPPERMRAFQAEVHENARKIDFIDPEHLKFYENATLYIQDVAVTNAYMYLDTRNMAGNNFWTFALNQRSQEIIAPRETVSTFSDEPADRRKLFALSLQTPDFRTPSETVLAAISGNLSYRLLAEGFLDIIAPEKRMRAFSWLVHNFQNLLRINNSFSRDFRQILSAMGEDISLYLLLWPEEMTDSIRKLITSCPFFETYADLRLSVLIYSYGSLERALSGEPPERECHSLSGVPVPPATAAEIQDLMFQKYILSSKSYTIDVRFSGDSSRLLYADAKNMFDAMLEERPHIFQDFIRNAVSSAAGFSSKSLFRALGTYKEKVFRKFFPGLLRLDDKTRGALSGLVSRIKNRQVLMYQYLAQSGSNIQNDIVYRIMEHSLERPARPLPGSLTVFRDRLANEGTWSYHELKKALSIYNLGKHSICISIFHYVANILGLAVFPNPDYECYEEMVSAFSSFAFKKEAPLPKIKQQSKALLCFRLALDTATVYTVQGRLLEFFKTWLRSANLPAEEASCLSSYASGITALRQSAGRACRPGNALSKIAFTAAEQDLLIRMMHIVTSGGDMAITMKNLSVINLHLRGRFLESFLTGYQRRPASLAPARRYPEPPYSGSAPLVPAAPAKLDPALIREKTRETSLVHEILAPIFADGDSGKPAAKDGRAPIDVALGKPLPAEEPQTASAAEMPPEDLSDLVDSDGAISGQTIFGLLPQNCRELILRLCQLGEFSEDDFVKICREFGLMSDGAMEIINSWALEHLDCTLIETDDPMFFDRDLLNDLLQQS
ncbi:tellurite resistance TerB C-terminal domain-containing protein [Succinimonas sp.]|uniref:tellurite resistance TerB C-terminal domain-containing protein n=1 Tax=Succinimonas sp. TaxID=1936151 RepID=UPI0038663039